MLSTNLVVSVLVQNRKGHGAPKHYEAQSSGIVRIGGVYEVDHAVNGVHAILQGVQVLVADEQRAVCIEGAAAGGENLTGGNIKNRTERHRAIERDSEEQQLDSYRKFPFTKFRFWSSTTPRLMERASMKVRTSTAIWKRPLSMVGL